MESKNAGEASEAQVGTLVKQKLLGPVPGNEGQALTEPPKTAQQMRVVEVSEALIPIYQRASMLELTDEEVAAITAPFPDETVEVRPNDGLIYIPHIFISDRFNQVFKPGRWSLLRRREWYDEAEEVMYGEYVLAIRGCYVGESVGGHPFPRSNKKLNYSDVLESTAAEALRRIGGKRLSCGSQVWNPEYARQWVARYAQHGPAKDWKGNLLWQKKAPGASLLSRTPAPAPRQAPPPALPPDPVVAPAPGSIKHKAPLPERIAILKRRLGSEERVAWAEGYLRSHRPDGRDDNAALLPNEGLESLTDEQVDVIANQWLSFMTRIEEFINDNAEQVMGEHNISDAEWDKLSPAGKEQLGHRPGYRPSGSPIEEEPVAPGADGQDQESYEAAAPVAQVEPWRTFLMPFGKKKGVRLEDLDKPYLYGLWANFQVETEWKGKPKAADAIARDTLFRQMLDQAGLHYEFTKND